MVRGVTASAFEMCNAQGGRRYATLVDGRMFKAGARELLVGAALARRYPEFAPGKSVTIHGISWAITGSFQSNGSIRESEFWTGLDTLRTDYGLGESYSVVAFTGTPQADVGAFNDALAAIEKGKLRVTDAATHYAGKGQDLVSLIGLFGVAFSALAGVVVLIGVAALAESLLVNLATELRTLRLIGFGRVLFAAFAGPFALLGIAGGLLGALACWLGTSALSFSTFSSAHEIVFRPVLTLPIAGLALLYGTVLALAAAGVNYRRIVRGA
ncbi:hypothetical protein [Burkholderia sp. 22PA0106]|uniref:hypothetical protein n=1 Tax=Burkholderia sp. 22PA0106 TaxID=3237371 RepID=UPI0039C40594